MNEPIYEDIEKEIEKARARLLDLTMRNRMLNFRPSITNTVRVVDERPAEAYSRLVLDERHMEMKARPTKAAESKDLFIETKTVSVDDETWDFDTSHIPQVHTDRYLQTELTSADLARRLKSIYQKSATVFEEQGYTVSFLALGFVEWMETKDTEVFRKAPLILVPVEIERKRVADTYTIKWTGEDIYTNVSLQAKLGEQGIPLPEFDMPDDKTGIDRYANNVRTAIRGIPGWRVTQGIYLGFFSFSKFVMYRDLDPVSWPDNSRPSSNPLIQSLFVPENALSDGTNQDFDDHAVGQLSIRDQFHVLDADSSQIAVIESVKMGRNLVVEGPPGTGKSQTITNLIAELLSDGKTVLFVSEKMAALEVVKGRLDSCGLGDSCLELHSRHTKKRSFVDELRRTMEAEAPEVPSLSRDFDEHDRLRQSLDAYVEALHLPIMLGKSPYDFFGMREQSTRFFDGRSGKLRHVNLPELDGISEVKYQEISEILNRLAIFDSHRIAVKQSSMARVFIRGTHAV
jgi:hypothetical protein